MSKPKIPECRCAACVKWNVDVEALRETADWLKANPWMGRTKRAETKRNIKELFGLRLETGCDLCGRQQLCVLFVPDIVRQFFDINKLCVLCRKSINQLQRYEEWPICWSATPDDEIKWFLIAYLLKEFQWHFAYNRGEFVMWLDCCVNGAHAKRAPVKPEPYQWPKMEWLTETEEVPDLEIELKPEFKRPRVRARTINVTSL